MSSRTSSASKSRVRRDNRRTRCIRRAALVFSRCRAAAAAPAAATSARTQSPRRRARAQILNGGTTRYVPRGRGGAAHRQGEPRTATVRVIAWTWRQTAGPSVRLIEANTTTVSFTAPHVSVAHAN